MTIATDARPPRLRWDTIRGRITLTPLLLIGILALAAPVMFEVAKQSWSTEQGAHGPLVFAIGLWLLAREWSAVRGLARPGSPWIAGGLLALLLPLYVVSRITNIVEVEGFALYASLLTAAYALWGYPALRRVLFPLFFLLFVFPPPDTLFAMLTQPLKIAISQWAVAILHGFGYPIAGSGVTIQIGQYEMLVAAACAGLNSLIGLTALGLFYIYLRHAHTNWRYMLLLELCILPVAVIANLVRVLLLLLITYHFGEAAGQGFFHELAGMTMFVTALLGIFLLDSLAAPIRRRLNGPAAAR